MDHEPQLARRPQFGHPCCKLFDYKSVTLHLLPAELSPVSSVSVDYTCTTNSVVVSWSPVFGAQSYMATAMGDSGAKGECTSADASCRIAGLSCGQRYEVHVTPMSGSCKNLVNATSATVQTGETRSIHKKGMVRFPVTVRLSHV